MGITLNSPMNSILSVIFQLILISSKGSLHDFISFTDVDTFFFLGWHTVLMCSLSRLGQLC